MNDTIMRQWQMLRMVPHHPRKVSTTELVHDLAAKGFTTTQRTVQRDLVWLSSIYPLVSDERSKPYGWSWAKDAGVVDIPGMDSHTALTFWLASQHLEPILPKSTLRKLQPHFRTAAKVLDHSTSTDKGAPSWRDKVRILNRGPNLQAPVIPESVQDGVYEALLMNKTLEIDYASRSQQEIKQYEVNPLGLVLKDGLFYLVCTMWDYQDIRLLVLHRIIRCKINDTPAAIPESFDLDAYIAAGELDFAIGDKIQLKALFDADAAIHLSERPLSDDQQIEKQDDGRMLITATTRDSSELRWWLLGFGHLVEVVEPTSLRAEFAEIAQKTAAHYGV